MSYKPIQYIHTLSTQLNCPFRAQLDANDDSDNSGNDSYQVDVMT